MPPLRWPTNHLTPHREEREGEVRRRKKKKEGVGRKRW
jgi:hypothetical protein